MRTFKVKKSSTASYLSPNLPEFKIIKSYLFHAVSIQSFPKENKRLLILINENHPTVCVD